MSSSRGRHSSDEYFPPRHAIKPILPYLPPNAVILDCAWGTGRLARHLARAGYRIVGGPECREPDTNPDR